MNKQINDNGVTVLSDPIKTGIATSDSDGDLRKHTVVIGKTRDGMKPFADTTPGGATREASGLLDSLVRRI